MPNNPSPLRLFTKVQMEGGAPECVATFFTSLFWPELGIAGSRGPYRKMEAKGSGVEGAGPIAA